MGINIGLYRIKWEFETMASYLHLSTVSTL